MSLAEALAYWSLRVAELDERIEPLRARDERLKDLILDTHKAVIAIEHGAVIRERAGALNLDTRADRVPLFEARMALLPKLGPLRQQRRFAQAEAKSLGLRIKAELALKEREAKRAAKQRRTA